MTKRAYTYSRYSHEDSAENSIEGQHASQDKYAARLGIQIIDRFADHAISGAAIFNRPSLTKLMQVLDNSDIDILLVDHLDRLTRDDGDMAYIHKELNFRDIELHSVAQNGKVDRNTASIMALVGRNQLESTAHAVRRGQELMIKEGRNTGGRAYGYKLTPNAGELIIDDGAEASHGEADVVRRIYRYRLSGMTPRDIAGKLNAEGIPGPTGGIWRASTLNGSRSRKYGILRNPIYKGEPQWNRVRMVKNPATGKRVSRINKKEDIVTSQQPHLAIVDADTFERVQAMFPQNENDRPNKYRKATTILTGLLKCGYCGGGMSVKDKYKSRRRIQCSTMKESRSCDNTSAYYLDEIVEASLSGLKDQLSKPEMLSKLIKSYNSERTLLASEAIEKTKIVDHKIDILSNKEEKIWADYDLGHFDPALANERIQKIRGEMEILKEQKEALPSVPETVSIHPSTVAHFKQYIDQLTKTFADQVTDENREAATAIRRLIDKITITPTKDGTDVQIDGLLGILASAAQQDPILGGLVVAGEGLEPPTRGL